METTEVKPYFSKEQSTYHICSNCPVGMKIESASRQYGDTGKRNLCPNCLEIINNISSQISITVSAIKPEQETIQILENRNNFDND